MQNNVKKKGVKGRWCERRKIQKSAEMVGKMMVSTFLANQAKEMSKVAIAVPSSFVMRVSGAHIKQQTSPGPVALSVFNRLGCFKLRIPELLTPAPASIRYNIV